MLYIIVYIFYFIFVLLICFLCFCDRALVAYIKENKLENTTNSKIISPDEKLKTLLDLNDSDELTYFTIQKYMNKHFVKNAEA